MEKQRGPHSKIRKFTFGNIEIVDKAEISKEFKKFHQELYGKSSLRSETDMNTFLDSDAAPKLSDIQIELCRKEII